MLDPVQKFRGTSGPHNLGFQLLTNQLKAEPPLVIGSGDQLTPAHSRAIEQSLGDNVVACPERFAAPSVSIYHTVM